MRKGATTPGEFNLLRPDANDYFSKGYVPLREQYDNSVSHALEYYIASHQFGQSLDIVRNIKRIIPCVALMETGTRLEVLALFRIERRVEGAVRQDRTQRSELLAIIMFVT